MDFDFLVGRYEWELKRKDQITTAVNFPVTILIFLGGVVVTMAKAISFQTPAIVMGYLVSAIFWTAVTGIALWLFASAYRASRYQYLPPLYELEMLRMISENEEQPAGFEMILRESIIRAVDRNSQSNDKRQALLDRGFVVLLVAVVMTVACGAFYVVDQILQT